MEKDSEENPEYTLAEFTTETNYAESTPKLPVDSPYALEAAPKKVRTINLLGFIRIPFAFISLVLAFWIALNLSSMIQSGNITLWMKNWSDNTQISFREYFDNGQIASYEGVITGLNDYAAKLPSGEIIVILESKEIPFTEEGDMPVSFRRALDAYDSKQCSILAFDKKVYVSQLDRIDITAEYQEFLESIIFDLESKEAKLKCK